MTEDITYIVLTVFSRHLHFTNQVRFPNSHIAQSAKRLTRVSISVELRLPMLYNIGFKTVILRWWRYMEAVAHWE